MVQPIQRVNVGRHQDLNLSRQAVIKTLVRQGLDQHYLAGTARKAVTVGRPLRTKPGHRRGWPAAGYSIPVNRQRLHGRFREFLVLHCAYLPVLQALLAHARPDGQRQAEGD